MPLFFGTVSKCRVKHIGQHLFKEGWFDSNTSSADCASGVLDLGEDRKNWSTFGSNVWGWKWWNRDLSHVGGGHLGSKVDLLYLYCSNIMDLSMIDPWFFQLIQFGTCSKQSSIRFPKKNPRKTTSHMHWFTKHPANLAILKWSKVVIWWPSRRAESPGHFMVSVW